MSSTSTPISPTSNSSNNANGEKQVPTLAEMVKQLNIEKLIEFLRDEDLQLTDSYFEVLCKEEIFGLSFGSATALVEFAKEVKDKKLSAFSSHRTLKDFKEVLAKCGIDITSIPQFSRNMETVADSNKGMRREYISSILHALVPTEWHFIKLATEELYYTSKSEYQINLSKMVLKEDLESIRKGVKT
ncbi:12714_t:CDS:2, partial [Dentiscutata erythropus]